jgi:7,8-dihydropterin-6-yl-methyl-4-(beta-D-ribofuranosyl)aminobenzene 5'-phosphate synthase
MTGNSKMKKIHGLHLPFPIQAVDRVEITTLIDNYVDVLLGNTGVVTRPVLRKGDEIPTDTVIAEHGLSMLVKTFQGEESHGILFDTGHNKTSVQFNLKQLGIDISGVEAIVLSHAHMDHTGGLYPIFEELSWSVPLVVHPEVFTSPRFLKWPDGRMERFPNTLVREDLVNRGAEILESQEPVPLANGTILVTGEVERKTSFEKGFPIARMMHDGELVFDPIRDDQALVVYLKEKGLVVISGCAHSGIVNTVLYSRKITGIETVYAILGGFHLTGPFFEPIIEDTVAAVKEMGPKVLVPMHCTGWKAMNRFSEAFPDAFILNSVGSKFVLS